METEDQSGGYQAPAEFPGTPPNTPVIRCLECGNPFPAQAQFCGVCGHKLTVPPEQDSGTKLSSSLLPSSPADTPPQVPPVSRRTATVFLSYSHQDRDFVLQLHRDLQAQGIHVWIDHESIQLGTPDWEVAVRRAIREADAIVLAASPDARQSRIVKDELNVADMYRRPIYPIWVTGEQWMESIPLGWGYIQHIDARGTAYTSGVQQLAKVLLALPARRSGLLAGHSGDLELLFEPRNPYKGLSAFSTRDAQDFFGREQLIQEVIQDCTSLLPPEQPGNGNPRLMALIGPSGSGKSSLVMAGILPHFQAGGLPGSKQWIYLKPLRPGSSPLPALAELFFALLPARDYRSILTELEGEDARGLHRLAAALTVHPDTKVVLFVDQFEELFTQVKDEKERQRFINLLLTAATEPHGPLIVFLALRADFYRPVQYPELARLIQNHYRPVPLMELKDLRSVIEKPAMLPDVQVQFQGDLVGDMLFEVQGQVGSLPLLQFTLEQLFQRRHDRLLTEQAYREIGGVKGALSRRAEEIYQKLPSDEHRQIARDIFLRLFVPGSPELDATRRRAARSELKQADPGQEQLVQQTLETFISARFLTTNQVGGTTTVEVSHEALSREWKRLTEWLQEARGDIQVQQSLSSAVAEWEREKRPRDRLYRGTPLKQAREWARHNRPSEQEAAFIQAGATRQVQSLLSGILIVLLLASSLGIAGWKVFFQPSPTLVTTLQDTNQVGSLRWCIDNAPSGSTITFDRSVRGILELTGGGLLFSGDKHLTIRGPGANQLAITGGNRNATIHISKGAMLDFSGLSFKNSETTINAFLFNEGTLKLTNSIVSNNKTDVFSNKSSGGIENKGTLTVINSTISNNTSIGLFNLGSGIYNEGQLTVSNSIISNNSAHATIGNGGGIFNEGTAAVTNSTFSNNVVSNVATTSINDASQGGGIFNSGKLTVTNSIFSNNKVFSSSGTSRGGGISNYPTGILMVSSSTFSENTAQSATNNSQGGGIDNEGKLTVKDTTFSSNQVISGSRYAFGGGINNYNTGTTIVSGSTFSGNIVKSDKQFTLGGGVYNEGKLTIINSTLLNNQAISGVKSFGGGILSRGIKGSSAIIRFCTIYENSSNEGGGIWGVSNLTISSSIIAHNNADGAPDIFGAVISEGYNLIENVIGVEGLNIRIDRQVKLADLKIESTLGNHGGPTQTLALLQGSQAIDVLPQQACSVTITDAFGHTMVITTDQRGDPRPDASENACDVGAYESSY